MKRERFPLSSDQLELLLAFEESPGLIPLSELLAKDSSVVSRNLQRLAETLPVISKDRGKWKITELGRSMNELSRRYLKEFQVVAQSVNEAQASAQKLCFSKNALLVVINGQRALQESDSKARNNPDAEFKVARLLQEWRTKNRPVAHVRHVSENPTSRFFRGSEGAEFIPEIAPMNGEITLEKTKASAFSGTSFAALIEERAFSSLILTGFTAGECIDSTARSAAELGIPTYVVSDATVTFDIQGPDGALHKAERVHKLVLANLHSFFAEVVSTDYLIRGDCSQL